MALRRNNVLAAGLILASLAMPARAEDYTINYMSHMDSITIGLGDAPTSNLVIQHPTPWPPYVNKTRINTPSGQGISALESMMQRYMPPSSAAPSSSVNADTSGMAGAAAAAGAN